jgi:hypothetical protein
MCAESGSGGWTERAATPMRLVDSASRNRWNRCIGVHHVLQSVCSPRHRSRWFLCRTFVGDESSARARHGQRPRGAAHLARSGARAQRVEVHRGGERTRGVSVGALQPAGDTLAPHLRGRGASGPRRGDQRAQRADRAGDQQGARADGQGDRGQVPPRGAAYADAKPAQCYLLGEGLRKFERLSLRDAPPVSERVRPGAAQRARGRPAQGSQELGLQTASTPREPWEGNRSQGVDPMRSPRAR